jgi:hypothetical protein
METPDMTEVACVRQVRGDFVLLRADTLRLLLPQRDVKATEYRESLPAPGDQPGVFHLESADGPRLPVAALSATMDLLREFPQNRFLLTRMEGDERGLALAWNDVRVLINAALDLYPLPAILQGKPGLVDAYVELDGELAFCTTARRVWAETRLVQE